MKRRLNCPAAGVALTCAILVMAAASAQAAPRDGVCQVGEFCLYYSDNLQGSVSDFAESISSYGTNPSTCYEFRGAGAGQHLCVKNNAASAWNRSSAQVAVY